VYGIITGINIEMAHEILFFHFGTENASKDIAVVSWKFSAENLSPRKISEIHISAPLFLFSPKASIRLKLSTSEGQDFMLIGSLHI